MPLRQPIVCMLGHVDTGKTLLLDRIRKTSVQAHEAGGITQHIGASFFPMKTLKEISGPLMEKFDRTVQIPGLLVIDTPGHEAFANLRKRGGNVSDVAILVVDILDGFQAQTYESIDILKTKKTPFIVAANKIDRIAGWRSKTNELSSTSYQVQDPYVRKDIDNRLYTIIGTLSRLGFQADRFDKVSDFAQTIAIVPVSAKTGEGILELLTVLIGLTQHYLKDQLQVKAGPAEGTVLEVKEETGLGITVNAVIFNGVLQKGDTIVIGGKEKPVVTKVRALLLPKPLDEIRDPSEKFSAVEAVTAATGVKIVAPNLEEALAGSPIYTVPSENQLNDYVKSVFEEVQKLRIATDIDGIVLKTDALGSLESIAESLERNNIPIRLADVGDVSKRDVIEASVVKNNKQFFGVILAFNVKILPDATKEAKNRGIPIFNHNTIYQLTGSYIQWMKKERESRILKELEKITRPGKIRLLPGCVFRKTRPAVVGIEVLAGQIKPKNELVREDGKRVGEIMQIQDRGETVSVAKVGIQVAVSLDSPTVGRHIHEGDILYVRLPELQAKTLLERFKDRLSQDELGTLNEFVEIMRRESPFWAI